jgi:hypothetical protein
LRNGSTVLVIDRGRVVRGVFPPEQVAQVKAIACGLPREHGLPLSRFSRAELHRLVVERGVCEASASTIARWLAEDALKPWQHRSWIFPTDPAFLEKAGPVLDLYQGRWEGKLLHPGEFVICADEKPSIQARARPPAAYARCRLARAAGRAHLPAARGAHLLGRARHRPPRGQAAAPVRSLRAKRRDRVLRPARLAGNDQAALCLRPPRLLDRRQRLLPPRPESRAAARAALAQPRPHPPARARQLAHQIEILFSIVQRKMLEPNDFANLPELARTLNIFERHWNEIAEPFEWNFTPDDLAALLERLAAHEHQRQLAA